MKSLHLFIILILLILVVYYHNKSSVYEQVEHFDDNIINQIASIANGEKITLKNVEINGTLTCNGDVNVSNDKTLSAKNLKTFNIESNYKNWIDIKPQVHMYDIAQVDKSFKAQDITVPKITTYDIYSTNGENGWLDLHANIHGYKGLQSDGAITGKSTIKSDGMLTARDITTRFLYSTGESGNYIDFKSGLYSPKETIIGCKSNKSKNSNFRLELDNNANNRQSVSIYGNGYVGIP